MKCNNCFAEIYNTTGICYKCATSEPPGYWTIDDMKETIKKIVEEAFRVYRENELKRIAVKAGVPFFQIGGDVED